MALYQSDYDEDFKLDNISLFLDAYRKPRHFSTTLVYFEGLMSSKCNL